MIMSYIKNLLVIIILSTFTVGIFAQELTKANSDDSGSTGTGFSDSKTFDIDESGSTGTGFTYFDFLNLEESGSTGTGGDVSESRMIQLFNAVITMKRDLLEILSEYTLVMESLDTKLLYMDLKNNKLKEAIELAEYRPKKKCVAGDGDKERHAATAEMDDIGGIICVDLEFLILQNASINDMRGNVIHELAHQMNYPESETLMLLIAEFSDAVTDYEERQEVISTLRESQKLYETNHNLKSKLKKTPLKSPFSQKIR